MIDRIGAQSRSTTLLEVVDNTLLFGKILADLILWLQKAAADKCELHWLCRRHAGSATHYCGGRRKNQEHTGYSGVRMMLNHFYLGRLEERLPRNPAIFITFGSLICGSVAPGAPAFSVFQSALTP